MRNSRVLSLRCQVSDLHRIAPVNIRANFVTTYYTQRMDLFHFDVSSNMFYLLIRLITKTFPMG